MPLHGLTDEQTARYQRARRLLEELAIYDETRAAVLIALTDDEEPNAFPTLKKGR